MAKSRNSVEKNYIYNLMYQMLVVVIPLVTTPYISRVLKADGVGAYSYTTAIVGYFALFGNLGVATYGQLKIAGLRNQKHELSKTFYELVILKAILMLTVTGLFLIFIQINGEEAYTDLYYVQIVHLVSCLLDISWLLQGLEEFKKVVIRNLIIKFSSVILIFAFVKEPSDLLLYTFIMTGSTLLGNLSVWLYLPRFTERVRFRELNIFQHLKPCLTYFIPTVATSIYLTLDKTMIGWFTTTSYENGYYEQAHKIEQIAVTVVTSLSVVTMPRMAFLYKNHETDKMILRLKQTIKFILMISIPMCLGMAAVSDYFIPLFLGDGYDKSAVLLQIFSLLIVVVGLNNAVGKQVLMPIGRQSQYNTSVIMGAIVNFILNLVMIPRLYSIGAAIASVAAETVILFMFVYYSKDYIKFTWIGCSAVKYLISAFVMFAAIRISYRWLSESWPCLILQIGAGVIIYFACLILLRDDFLIGAIKTSIGKLKSKIK